MILLALMVQGGEEKPPSLKSCSNDENRENAAQFFSVGKRLQRHTHTNRITPVAPAAIGTSGRDTEGYGDMDRNHVRELRVATDAQGGTNRATSRVSRSALV